MKMLLDNNVKNAIKDYKASIFIQIKPHFSP